MPESGPEDGGCADRESIEQPSYDSTPT
jgi:hypothetical protein